MQTVNLQFQAKFVVPLLGLVTALNIVLELQLLVQVILNTIHLKCAELQLIHVILLKCVLEILIPVQQMLELQMELPVMIIMLVQ